MAIQRVVKRGMDVVGALALLVLSLPLWAVLAWLIRRDSPGPAIFHQTRVGLDGRLFVLWKFRTMHLGAEHQWQPPTPETFLAYTFQAVDDPRVTRIGRWLRRTSLDELPQLVNVLVGDMSFVGPRPEIPEMVALYHPDMHRRHRLRPGLTGLAQVSGRGDLTTGEILTLDLQYCDTWSLRLDLQILCQTVDLLWSGAGAR